ncbi:bacteriorhodopsin [Halopiger goleimassiliensis]|uniref:bacteriorhodopsin n=1 Tax=Halopiger goleimassiliensis TaxID=1293048 RepID=UPI000677FEF6|nr:bacteriorhodopsin [Halopiger goleimassiliensis]
MIDPTSVFWLGALGMAAGTLAFVWGGVTGDDAYRKYYGLLAATSSIATVAYATMALGIGWIPVGDELVFAPRYVDWILTTPLLLLFLGLLAGSDRRELGLVVGINTAVMGLGFAAALLEGAVGYGLFALGGIAYVGLLYVLLGPMSVRAGDRRPGTTSLFTSLRNLTVILWSVYPAIWLLGPPGLGLLTPVVDVALITYLDLLTKVGFGLIALNASAVIEAERGESLAADSSAAPADD